MFFYLSILAAALLLSIIVALLLESQKTSKRFGHLPWVGMTSQQWWKLNYVRAKNFINLKQDFTSITDQVGTE
jgi:hypothetical protein